MALTLAHRAPLTLARDVLSLTRPGVSTLVVLTAPAGFVVGGSPPSPWTAAGVLVGTALLAAGCSGFNAVIDAPRDARMGRTRDRPLPSGRLLPAEALATSAAFSLAGLGLILGLGGPLAALVGAATWIHYVVVYSLWLKPRTPQSIVIGGAAGATAPLIADAAAHGGLGPASLLMAALIVLWTPPHFWAIALVRQRDYADAGFPTMPAVVGAQATRWRMFGYAIAALAVSLTLAPLVRWPYLPVAAVAGSALVLAVGASLLRPSLGGDRRVFVTSVVTLGLQFATLATTA